MLSARMMISHRGLNQFNDSICQVLYQNERLFKPSKTPQTRIQKVVTCVVDIQKLIIFTNTSLNVIV